MAEERETGTTLEGFPNDHINRYRFALDFVTSSSSVLDAGCGVGYGSNILACKAKKVVGIDYSEEAIEYACKYWARSNICFIKGNLLDKDVYPAELFDIIIAFEIIEHLRDDTVFLEILKNKLKPKGILIISTPNAQILNAADNPFHIKHYYTKDFYRLLKKYYRYVVPLTQRFCGITWHGCGDNNVLVCSDLARIWIMTFIIMLRYELYHLKVRLMHSFIPSQS